MEGRSGPLGGDVADVLINDDRVARIPIVDIDEPLIPAPVATYDHPRGRNEGPSRFTVRAGVAQRLAIADAGLEGASLVLVEGHRETVVQERFWNDRYAKLQHLHPDWSPAALAEETARFVAPPDGHPPHSTGGAVDVILLDLDGIEIDMGSALNDPCPQMAMAARVTADARAWRERLATVMSNAGFVNYPQEWWHFSFGDQYWAWRTDNPVALYGRVG